MQLVQPGLGTEDTRRLATREEVGDANWPLVQRTCVEALSSETKDLEVAAWLSESLCYNEGFAGLDEGLQEEDPPRQDRSGTSHPPDPWGSDRNGRCRFSSSSFAGDEQCP